MTATAPVITTSAIAVDDDDLDSIEVLSAQYRPTASVHQDYSSTNHHTPAVYAAGVPVDTDHLINHHHPRQRNLDTIRSVDDYEKDTYYFPSTRPTPSPADGVAGAASSSNRHGQQSRSRSQSGGRVPADHRLVGGVTGNNAHSASAAAKSTLIPVPIYNGDMVLLETAAATNSTKESLSPEERKRKRITLAVGIIAGIIIIASILLVAITLNMTSRIDAIVKEQNDNIYAQLTANSDYGLSWKNSSSAQNYPILQYSNRDSI
ncbi:uncharacterized protein LOC129588508 [Paramacrobiotus metropolitanus]|uniref:uncharacterized protein LOC129588508 n=1 Tax=Paramacrobiotus metropolitanus TaxID=2943436 RepID=UPI002445ABFC|nr:uncharacterized protein LOC129588508 [Paramacrobiotus metropolitanus]XP_055338714.1 uncharacterized protein LOC129588508 [Paramacrobiotus metropolitanus]XP_055338715.1 uncharacterized protein LOC129588508 [Paramacrobiotus metropolitanus]XP_055338716.1 uncharacterized protein LOC129588508 [Paramacrobiotus metropolitanus]